VKGLAPVVRDAPSSAGHIIQDRHYGTGGSSRLVRRMAFYVIPRSGNIQSIRHKQPRALVLRAPRSQSDEGIDW
jgi:hypothetical protein